jgi:long-chain alkane monooxygenase
VADVGRFTGHTIRIVGTPEQIADRLMQWRAAGIGGINVMNATIPGSYVEFIDYVMPVLQDRRLAQREYAKGSIRRKLTGAGLPAGPTSRRRLPWRIRTDTTT